MLKPEYFDGKEQRMMELYQPLSEFILKEAARFLIAVGKITPTADRLLQRLRLMGETQAEEAGSFDKTFPERTPSTAPGCRPDIVGERCSPFSGDRHRSIRPAQKPCCNPHNGRTVQAEPRGVV